jgi:hypothetical protein
MTPALLRQHDHLHPNGLWIIEDLDGPRESRTILWSRPRESDEDTGEYPWPLDMRQEYERLLNRPEFSQEPLPQEPNLVEFIAGLPGGGDGCAFDQKCLHGNRVGTHAVYCHNDRWLYAPRKCRRGERFASIYGGEPADYAHEKCPGFLSNPQYQYKD